MTANVTVSSQLNLTSSLPLSVNGSLTLQPSSLTSVQVGQQVAARPALVVSGTTVLNGNLYLELESSNASQTVVVVQSDTAISGQFSDVVATTRDSCTRVDSAVPEYGTSSVSVTVSVSNTCLSTGAIVGIAVGAAVGLALVVLGAVLLIRYLQGRSDARMNVMLRTEEMRAFR